jgi:hypothetical protein
MHCNPLIVDECFVRSGLEDMSLQTTRHFQCTRATPDHNEKCTEKGPCHVCKPLSVVRRTEKKERVFDLCANYSQYMDSDETNAMYDISGWLTDMDRKLFQIWQEQTEKRSLSDEQERPLSSMAIIAINQCAVNLVAGINAIPSVFPMRALFVSCCIGWTVFWKKIFQDTTPDGLYPAYIKAPWETITDLYRAFQRILKLVALVRHRHIHPTGDVVDSITMWTSSSETTAQELDRHTHVQRGIDTLVHILASGRVSTNGEMIVGNYVIPRYHRRNGNLYMYFRDRDREMMCQASTALVSSLLACTLPFERFGTHSIPGHIYVVWMYDEVYVQIETTMFNAETYSELGVSYTYTLPPPHPVSNIPYIYLDRESDDATSILYALDSEDNVEVLSGYSTVSAIFPFTDSVPIVCKGIPLLQIHLQSDVTLRFEFPTTITSIALWAFHRHYIVRYLMRKLSIVPVGEVMAGFKEAYEWTIANHHIDITVGIDPSITISEIVDVLMPLMSQTNEPIVLRTGILREPLVPTTRGVAASIMRNVVVHFTQTPSSGDVTVDMQSYMAKKTKGRSWARVKAIIAALKMRSNKHVNDRKGNFSFRLDTEDASDLVEELDTILLRETDGLSRAMLTPKDPYGEILDDRVVDIPHIRPSNLIAGRHSVSQLIAYQWYYGISVMGLSDVSIRQNLETFEQSARECDTCIQQTIIGIRPVLLEHFGFIERLSIRDRSGGEKRKM